VLHLPPTGFDELDVPNDEFTKQVIGTNCKVGSQLWLSAEIPPHVQVDGLYTQKELSSGSVIR
jgi:hypothetical protein